MKRRSSSRPLDAEEERRSAYTGPHPFKDQLWQLIRMEAWKDVVSVMYCCRSCGNASWYHSLLHRSTALTLRQ